MAGVLRGVASDLSKSIADLTYARLDGTNQPFTGAVVAPYAYILGGGSSPYDTGAVFEASGGRSHFTDNGSTQVTLVDGTYTVNAFSTDFFGSGSPAYVNLLDNSTGIVGAFGDTSYGGTVDILTSSTGTGIIINTGSNPALSATGGVSTFSDFTNVVEICNGTYAINANGSVLATDFNGVALTTSGGGVDYLSDDGTYKSIDLSGYVPYTGATTDVDLDTFNITANDYQTTTNVVEVGFSNATPTSSAIMAGVSNSIGITGTLSTSAVYGVSNSAQGTNAVSMGVSNQAGDAFNSGGVAVGVQNLAGQNTDVSVGFSNIANGGVANNSAVGYDNTATNGASAVGSRNTANLLGSSAIGYLNTSAAQASALGYSNTASGSVSSAIGASNTASALNAVATGFNNQATFSNCVSVGRNNIASTVSTSVSIGSGNTSTNGMSAIGTNNSAAGGSAIGVLCTTASRFDNTAIGYDCDASGASGGATAMGYSTNASSFFSTAIGFFSNATGQFSNAIGWGANATNTNASAIGKNVTASASNSSIIGWGSSTITNSTADTQQIVYGTANIITQNSTRTSFNLPIIGTGLSMGYVAKTGAYTTLAGDHTIDCTSGTFTVTLLTAVGNAGKIYVIKNSGAGVITVDGAGAETIDGAATQTLATQYESITIQSNGANWIIISRI